MTKCLQGRYDVSHLKSKYENDEELIAVFAVYTLSD